MTYLTKSAAILALLATAACTDTSGGLFGGGGSDVSGAGIGTIDEYSLEYFQASGSDRHLRAVAMMLRISGDSVDQLELERWIDELDLREAIQNAQRYEP